MAKRAKKKAKRKVVRHGNTDGIRLAVVESAAARLNRRLDKLTARMEAIEGKLGLTHIEVPIPIERPSEGAVAS